MIDKEDLKQLEERLTKKFAHLINQATKQKDVDKEQVEELKQDLPKPLNWGLFISFYFLCLSNRK